MISTATSGERKHITISFLTRKNSIVRAQKTKTPDRKVAKTADSQRLAQFDDDWCGHVGHFEICRRRAPASVSPARSSVCTEDRCELHHPWHRQLIITTTDCTRILTTRLSVVFISINESTNQAQSEYKHSQTFCIRAMLSQQRNPCSDCKSAK